MRSAREDLPAGGVAGWAASGWRRSRGPRSPPSRAKPNIVIILADDLGYADLGFQGCHDIPTPHIDSLAQDGVRCANGYVSGPYCSPTRAGLLTGRYQQRFGHEFNPGPDRDANFGLPADRDDPRRSAEGRRLRHRAGRQVAPRRGAAVPARSGRGFDEFFGFLGGGHPYFPGQGRADLPRRPRSSRRRST